MTIKPTIINIKRNKKAETYVSAFCTQDISVLELFQKDLVHLYGLRIPLKQEGLSNYSVNPPIFLERIRIYNK